jgi:hypothetical protein
MFTRFGAAGVMLAVGTLTSAATAQLDITTIARNGDAAFSLGGEWTNAVFRFDVNDAGRVAFVGLSSIPDADGVASDGVFTFDPASGLSLLIRDDTAATPDANYAGFVGAQIAADGTVLFGGRLRNTTPGGPIDAFNSEFLASSSAGIVAREGNPSEGGTAFPTTDGDVYLTNNATGSSVFSEVFLDGSGGFVFRPGFSTNAFLTSDGTSVRGDDNYWRQTAAGDTTLAVDPRETVLPGDLRVGFNPTVTDINDAGQIVFGTRVLNADGSSPTSTSDSGIYIQQPDGTITEVVRATGGTALDSIDNLESSFARLDDAGNAFFTAQRRVNLDNRGLYTNAGGFRQIARLGGLVVVNDGEGNSEVVEITEFHDPTGFAVGGPGEVAFRVRARQNSFPNDERNAILHWSNGTLVERVTETDEVLGLPDGLSIDLDPTLSTADTGMAFNSLGTLGFLAQIGVSDKALIASLEDGTNIFIAGEGLLFPFSDTEDKVLTQITHWGIDDTNRITLSALFADNTAGLYSIVIPAPGVATLALLAPAAMRRRRR